MTVNQPTAAPTDTSELEKEVKQFKDAFKALMD